MRALFVSVALLTSCGGAPPRVAARVERVDESVGNGCDDHRLPGRLEGTVTDRKGATLAGVTVVVTSRALEQARAARTDEQGLYTVADLPPCDYSVTFYYDDVMAVHDDIHVESGVASTIDQKLDAAAEMSPVVNISPSPQRPWDPKLDDLPPPFPQHQPTIDRQEPP